MQTYLNIVQIILSVVLVILVLLEMRSSAGGGLGGSQTGLIRKRRGPELLLFRLTAVTAVLFFLVAIINVLVIG